MARETTGVGSFCYKVVAQVACNREVHHARVRRFQVVIDSPINCEAIRVGVTRWGVRKSVRTWNPGTWRENVQPLEARRSIHSVYTCRVADCRRQSPGTLPVEGVYDSFPEVIEVQPISCTDGT